MTLLVKWWWKFKDLTYQSLWKTLIVHLYYTYPASHSILSFWTNIMQLDNLGSNSVQYQPGSNYVVRFWEDIWYENCTIASKYPQLYSSCLNKNILFSELISSQGQNVIFHDILTRVCLMKWNQVLTLLNQLSFTHEFDKLSWRCEQTWRFSVNSLYHVLNYRGVLTEQPLLWQNLPLPPKIKTFMWLSFQNKVLSKANLRKKKDG